MTDKTVALDGVLDLIRAHQEALAKAVDAETPGYQAHKVLWAEYKRVSKLYDDVRKISK